MSRFRDPLKYIDAFRPRDGFERDALFYIVIGLAVIAGIYFGWLE
jgi:hypothetical protein